jgi:hypothetical protein
VATKVRFKMEGNTQVNGSKFEDTLKEMKCVPHLWLELFSINKVLTNGFYMSNNGISICPSKGALSVLSDTVITTTNDQRKKLPNQKMIRNDIV